MTAVRILTLTLILFAHGIEGIQGPWAEEAQKTSPQRQLTGTGSPAGATAGQTTGERGFLSRELILGAIAVAALAVVAIEAAGDSGKPPGPGGTTPTTTTTTATTTGN